MKTSLNLNHQLPFIQLRIWYKGQSLLLDRILVDTGSASTIFKLDIVEKIGITAEQDDIVGSISGVGGSEYIFLKQIDSIEINGIVGMDFLLKIKGVIDLNQFILESQISDYA